MPMHGSGNDCIQITMARCPAERAHAQSRISNKHSRIPRPFLLDRKGNRPIAQHFGRSNKLMYAYPSTGSKVERAIALSLHAVFQCQNMSDCQILNMNIVPDACSVRSRVVVSVNFQTRILSKHGADYAGQQMRFRLMPFANLSVRITASGIKIAQGNPVDSMCRMIISQHPFHEKFGGSIGVDGRRKARLGNRHFVRFPINGTCTGNDDIGYPFVPHGIKYA